jgi:hypothetical protein
MECMNIYLHFSCVMTSRLGEGKLNPLIQI